MIAAVHSCTAALMPSLVLAFALGVAGCEGLDEPPGPPYLAIVTNMYALGSATAPAEVTYRITDLNAPLVAAKRLHRAPGDTVIVSLPPSAYQVQVEGLPTRCRVSNGAARAIVLTDEDNTGIIRYSIQCLGMVSIAVVVDGPMRDTSFVYRVRQTGGADITGLVGANDTTTVDDAGAGEYEVQLGGVAANCVIISDGGPVQRMTVAQTGGATASFRITCADLAHRPQLLSLVGGYSLGSAVFTFRVWDPDHDIDGYVFDLTDCRGNSVMPDGRERMRRGLLSGRGQLADTLVVVGAYELGLASTAVAGTCTELRVFDEHGNTSVILTHRMSSSGGLAPTVRFFNATLQGTSSVTSILAASDPENDIVGHFVLVRLRDGVLGAPDGIADLGSMDPVGYVHLDVPPIPMSTRIRWDDVLGVIVFVIDAKGNAIRVEDSDIFR
jgi:hypothetical protein